MGSAMRSFVLLALLLAAAPAWAGDELIRFRQADGTLGLVDDDDKLPPGAVVLERTPLARPSRGAGRLRPGPRRGDRRGSGGRLADEHRPGTLIIEPRRSAAPSATELPVDAEAARGNAALCSRYHLDSDCTESDRAVAADWCQRSGDARSLLEQAEEEMELRRRSSTAATT